MERFEIPIWLEECHNLNRTKEPIRLGVPFPQGLLINSSNIRLMNSLRQFLPVQSRSLGVWPDGSIKWLLIDFFADLRAFERSVLTLVCESFLTRNLGDNQAVIISIIQSKEFFYVSTGKASFQIPRDIFLPFKSVQIGDAAIISAQSSRTQLIRNHGVEYNPVIDRFNIEEPGPFRASLLAEGRFVSSRFKPVILFKARLVFFADQSVVRLEFLIRNPQAALHPGGLWDLGDLGSFFFKELSISLCPHGKPQQLFWYTEQPENIQVSNIDNWILYQDSSGGKNWNSRNHLTHSGDLSVSFCGYHVRALQNNELKLIDQGLRANPGVRILTSSGWLAATVMDFWQNFPKALTWRAGFLSVGLFPGESRSEFELQGGEQKRHIIYFDFGLPHHDMALPMFQHPIHAALDPNWVEKTSAISFFVPQREDRNEKYLQYINQIIEGPESFIEKRELIDEYGWRNFGDLYADHEAVNQNESPMLISHYNNQYDFIYGAFAHFLRTGDRRWYQLMDEAAKHSIDIDIYHTDEDRSAFNHGLFWHTEHYKDARTSTHRAYSRENGHGKHYGGGPSSEHIYTSGLLHYYYLTGDTEAMNAVLELADWVLELDDGVRNLLGLFDEGPTGHASQTVSTLYHKPGRGAGNSISTLIDAYSLTNARQYFKKAEEIIQRCIHPKDNIFELKFEEPEYRWSYLSFLQVIRKYLHIKLEFQEIDYSFFYSRDSLLHYANWMLKNEVPYKDILHKVEIPTETWPAQDIRKCCVFHFAAEFAQPDERLLFRKKADFFFERCLTDLLSFHTASLTRPLVILCVYGYPHSYFQKYNSINLNFRSHCYDFGNPEQFIPQKVRFKTVFLKKIQVAKADIKRLIITKFYAFCRIFN